MLAKFETTKTLIVSILLLPVAHCRVNFFLLLTYNEQIPLVLRKANGVLLALLQSERLNFSLVYEWPSSRSLSFLTR